MAGPQTDTLLQFDEFTRLRNRRYLWDFLRDTHGPRSVLLVDIDHLKALNSGSRKVGDYVVQEIARRQNHLTSAQDVIVRYGGDEFCMVLPPLGPKEAAEFASAIRHALESSPLRPTETDPPVSVTLSIGIATDLESRAGQPYDILERAHRALAAAKIAGGNATVIDSATEPPAADTNPFAGFPCPRMVGRDDERDLIRGAAGKLPRVVLIHGAPGIGKTRLMRECLDILRSPKVLSVSASADDSTRFSPMRAVGDLIEGIAKQDPEIIDLAFLQLAADQIKILRSITPMFQREEHHDLAIPTPEEAAGTLVALLGVAREKVGSVIFGLDEAALADDFSLDTLAALLKYPVPVLLIATSSDATGTAPDGRDSRLPALIAEASSRRKLQLIGLAPLAPGDVDAMITSMLPGTEPFPELAAAITGVGGGIPLYVEEALRTLVLGNIISVKGNQWTLPYPDPKLLPPTLRQGILKNLLTLPSQARDLVNHAAVLGARFDIDLLQEALGWREYDLYESLDRLLRSKLMKAVDPNVPEVLEFSTAFTRTLIYDSLDPMARRKIHARLATILGAADEEGLSGDFAFHLDRCGAAEVAQVIRKRSAKSKGHGPQGSDVRFTRIPEAKEPLSDDAGSALETGLRALVGMVKTARIYPQHSQIRNDFQKQVGTSLDQVMALAKGGVTIKIEGAQLQINSLEVDIRKASWLSELIHLLDGRLITSLTLVPGLTADELGALLSGLIDPFDLSTVETDHWDRFLKARSVRHFDVVQRSYVPQRGQTEARLKKAEENPLDTDGLMELQTALRFLRGASDNLKLYPPGHAQVEELFRDGRKAFAALLARADVVTLAPADGKVLVNGKLYDTIALGQAGRQLVGEIETRKLKSLTFMDGLTEDELRVLASYLSLPAGDSQANEVLERSDVRHVVFGARLFQKRRTVTLDENAPEPVIEKAGRDGGKERKKIVKRPRADIRARMLLGQPPGSMVADTAARGFPLLLEALNFGSTCDLAAQVVQHLMAAAKSGPALQRVKALYIVFDSLDGVSKEAARLLIAMSSLALRDTILEETDPTILKAAADILPRWIQASLVSRSVSATADVLRDGLAKRRAEPNLAIPMREYLHGIALKICGSPAMATLTSKLAEGSRDDKRYITKLIVALGEPAGNPLITFFLDDHNAPSRPPAAEAIAKIGPKAVGHLLERLRNATASQLLGTLDVVDTLGPDAIVKVFEAATASPDVAVRDAAFQMVRRLRNVAAPALGMALKDLGIRAQVLKVATEIKLAPLAPHVAALLEETVDPAVINLCCRYFASVPDPVAVEPLGKILKGRSQMFKHGFPDSVRADAVWGLSNITDAKAKALMEEAKKDPSAIVRGAARTGHSRETTFRP